jgi:hypothetical protein
MGRAAPRPRLEQNVIRMASCEPMDCGSSGAVFRRGRTGGGVPRGMLGKGGRRRGAGAFLSWCGEVIPPEPWQSVSGKATDLFFRQAAALFPPFQMKICHTFIIDVDSTICFVW